MWPECERIYTWSPCERIYTWFLCELFTHGDEVAIWASVYFTMLRKSMALVWPFVSNIYKNTFEKLPCTACAKNSMRPFWIVLLMVTRQLPGPACTKLFIHMLKDCMLHHVSGEKGGVRSNSIIIFHYTLLEHIYPYVSSQFKLPPEHQLCKCNLLVPPVWILQANHSGAITLHKAFSNISLRFAGCFDDSLSTAQDKSKLIVKECEE